MLHDIFEPRPPQDRCLSLTLAVACLPSPPARGKRIDPRREHFSEYYSSMVKPQVKHTGTRALPSKPSAFEEDPDDVPNGCIPQLVGACEASKRGLAYFKDIRSLCLSRRCARF